MTLRVADLFSGAGGMSCEGVLLSGLQDRGRLHPS